MFGHHSLASIIAQELNLHIIVLIIPHRCNVIGRNSKRSITPRFDGIKIDHRPSGNAYTIFNEIANLSTDKYTVRGENEVIARYS